MKGQFDNTLLNILLWLVIIGFSIWFIMLYIKGAGNNIPGESLLKP
jgi:hypothetical protein